MWACGSARVDLVSADLIMNPAQLVAATWGDHSQPNRQHGCRPWQAMDGLARYGQRRSSMVGHGSTFLFSVTASVGQLWPAEAKFGQPTLAKAVLDLIHEFHLCHQPDVLELPAS